MAFERFPDETLLDVVNYVGLDGSVSSWRHLASVNRTLHRIVTPLLYEQFAEANKSSAPKLLRTILANPQLATEIKRYKGHGIANEPPQRPDRVMATLGNAPSFVVNMVRARVGYSGMAEREYLDMSGFLLDDFIRCRKIFKRIPCQKQDEWLDDISLGKWHAVTSLILLLLTNLEEFEVVDYRDDVESGYFETALGIAARLQQYPFTKNFALKHLTHVSLAAHDKEEDDDYYGGEGGFGFEFSWDTGYLYLTDIIPFLKLPSVRSMLIQRLSSTEGCHHEPLDYHSKELKFTTKQLELHDSVLGMTELTVFLSKFTQLRRLSYEHIAPREDFLPQDIGKAIAHLKPCLEELDLSHDVEENGYNETPRQIGSLAGFEKLKLIDVEGPILLGYRNSENGSLPNLNLCDLLPRSLENLRLDATNSWNEEEGHLKALLAAKDKKFPCLKTVMLKGWRIKDLAGMKRDFKAKGVKLTKTS